MTQHPVDKATADQMRKAARTQAKILRDFIRNPETFIDAAKPERAKTRGSLAAQIWEAEVRAAIQEFLTAQPTETAKLEMEQGGLF